MFLKEEDPAKNVKPDEEIKKIELDFAEVEDGDEEGGRKASDVEDEDDGGGYDDDDESD